MLIKPQRSSHRASSASGGGTLVSLGGVCDLPGGATGTLQTLAFTQMNSLTDAQQEGEDNEADKSPER